MTWRRKLSKSENVKIPTPQHWRFLGDLVRVALTKIKGTSKEYTDKEKLMQYCYKKAVKKTKTASTKTEFRYKCLDCNEIHEKISQKNHCISCDSTNIKKITDWTEESEE